MLKIINSQLHESYFDDPLGYDDVEEEPQYRIRASLQEQPIIIENDEYVDFKEAFHVAKSLAQEMFSEGQADKIWIEDIETSETFWSTNLDRFQARKKRELVTKKHI